MKKLQVSLLVLLIGLVLLPSTLLAQDGTPPPCCGPKPPTYGMAISNPTASDGSFTVSVDVLQSQGITRSQFVDRLSQALFPEKSADILVYSVTQTTSGQDARSQGFQMDSAAQGLIAMRQTLIYRLPRWTISSEELDKLDKVGLTDGQFSVTISFTKNMLLESN